MKTNNLPWILASLSLFAGCAATSLNDQPTITLTAQRVAALPEIDGDANDAVWKQAKTLSFDAKGVWGPSIGTSAKVDVKAVYTVEHVAFLVSWEDATRDDVRHKPWAWNAGTNAYEQSREQEDALALAFEHSGPFKIDMLSHIDAVWDLWTWKAARTNPVGFALDKTHRYSTKKPEGKAKEYPSRSGAPIWIQRPDDSGETAAAKRPAPSQHEGDLVAQYTSRQPNGSAADVRARGRWANGRWTVELLRKLDTGHADDTAFDPKREYAMAVAVQDRTGDMDKASPPMQLQFARPQTGTQANPPIAHRQRPPIPNSLVLIPTPATEIEKQ